MFNKKRKAAEKQARLAQRTKAEEQFAADIVAADEIKDPAEQILKLTEIEGEISVYALWLSAEISKMSIVGHKIGTVAGVLAFVSVPIAFAIAPAPMTVVAVSHLLGGSAGACAASLVGGNITDVVNNIKTIKARKKEEAVHIERIAGFAKQVAEIKEMLINNEADGIAQSPFYERVLKLPELSDAFDGAAAKQIEKLKREAEETHKATQQRQRDAAPRPSLDRYDRLKDPFGYKK